MTSAVRLKKLQKCFIFETKASFFSEALPIILRQVSDNIFQEAESVPAHKIFARVLNRFLQMKICRKFNRRAWTIFSMPNGVFDRRYFQS